MNFVDNYVFRSKHDDSLIFQVAHIFLKISLDIQVVSGCEVMESILETLLFVHISLALAEARCKHSSGILLQGCG